MQAITAAMSFLTLHQDEDGHWRDYQLAPGRSEAWTTGCVGCALLAASAFARVRSPSIHRAAKALLATRRPEGWGYNSKTACDANSTSWVICFLAQLGMLHGISTATLLSLYSTPTGRIRTFASLDRFGSWAMEHDEVAPLAGLALLAAGEQGHASRIRSAVLDGWGERGWTSFWWRGDAYPRAQSLWFLAVGGGIPEAIAMRERKHLSEVPKPTSAFEAAQQLSAAVHLGATGNTWLLGNTMLNSQSTDGGWPSSLVLLTPNQREPHHFDVQCDDRRLLTTAVSLVALTRWVEREV